MDQTRVTRAVLCVHALVSREEISGKCRDAWKVPRRVESAETRGKCRDVRKVPRRVESAETRGKCRDAWKVPRRVESAETCGKCRDVWKVPRRAESAETCSAPQYAANYGLGYIDKPALFTNLLRNSFRKDNVVNLEIFLNLRNRLISTVRSTVRCKICSWFEILVTQVTSLCSEILSKTCSRRTISSTSTETSRC